MRRFGLFLAMSIAAGTSAVGGALLGGALLESDAGFLGGGLAAGLAAVLAAARLSVLAGCLPQQRLRAVLVGASVGLMYAAAFSVATLLTVVLPFVGFLLVGAGAAWGDYDAEVSERRTSAAPVG